MEHFSKSRHSVYMILALVLLLKAICRLESDLIVFDAYLILVFKEFELWFILHPFPRALFSDRDKGW